MIERLAVVQIDSVNVLSRSHYLPAFSRLGAYPRAALDELTRPAPRGVRVLGARGLVPARAAAAAPALAHGGGRAARLGQHGPAPARAARLRRGGPRPGPHRRSAQGRRPRRGPGPTGRGRCGTGTTARSRSSGCSSPARSPRPHRTTAFEKVYDLTERVLPAEVLRDADARPGRRRPRAGPHRGPRARRGHRARPARLLPARARRPPGRRSPSWPTPVSCCRSTSPAGARPAWLDPEARRPRWIRARALLSPFDSLVWERPRVERIFGFRYRLEIYTPAAKRVHGYYVLPFLLGDQLVARVDLKADRQAGVLRVQAAHGEEGIERPLVAAALGRRAAPHGRLAGARRRRRRRARRPGGRPRRAWPRAVSASRLTPGQPLHDRQPGRCPGQCRSQGRRRRPGAPPSAAPRRDDDDVVRVAQDRHDVGDQVDRREQVGQQEPQPDAHRPGQRRGRRPAGGRAGRRSGAAAARPGRSARRGAAATGARAAPARAGATRRPRRRPVAPTPRRQCAWTAGRSP